MTGSGRHHTWARRREAVEDGIGAVGDLAPAAVEEVALHHGDDLVVRLAPVDQAQAADRDGLDEDVAVGDRLLAEHADVERVAVAFDSGAAGGPAAEGG